MNLYLPVAQIPGAVLNSSFPVMGYLRCPNNLYEIPPWFKLARISFCCFQSKAITSLFLGPSSLNFSGKEVKSDNIRYHLSNIWKHTKEYFVQFMMHSCSMDINHQQCAHLYQDHGCLGDGGEHGPGRGTRGDFNSHNNT